MWIRLPVQLQLKRDRKRRKRKYTFEDEQEPVSLRCHRRTYPRHLIWRKRDIVTGQLRMQRLYDGIDWAS